MFVNESKKNLFSVVDMENEDVIWIKMKKGESGEARNVFIGTCYLNPPASQKDDLKISQLEENVILLQEKGDVIIQGDFNARTSDLDDTIPPDNLMKHLKSH